MLWVDRWINYHAVTNTLLGPGFQTHQISGDAAGGQMLSWWSHWGSRPTWNDPQTHCIYIKYVWHYSYAMDWPIDQPSCRFQHTIYILDVIMVEWLRLKTYKEWSPHPLLTYTRWLTLFICYGWSNRSTIMPSLPHLLLIQIYNILNNWVMQLGCKSFHNGFV